MCMMMCTGRCLNAWLGEKFNMKKISVSLSGHQTSISLESEFIAALTKIARSRKKPLASIISEIDATRGPNENLSSAIRVYVLKYFYK